MKFDSLSAFLQMDGHGVYIWAAYGLTLIILAANVWFPWITRRSIIQAEKSAILKSMAIRKSKERS
ncbi:MAG: heme exporter protein CcmD [Candidatus Azotimanducaceae bacterium WSBS_2022_MAG_OTU7]